jgi:CRP-like cAMP-binding protein
MEESDFFGEIGVLFSVPRTVTCRAKAKCLLLILTKDALTRASEEYPHVADSIGLIAQERFSSYIKQRNNAVRVDFAEEINLSLTQTSLKEVPLFKDCEVGFLHMLAIQLTPHHYYAGETIFRKGDQALEMFFMVKGTAEAFSEEDGTIYATFNPGSFFGEVGLFFDIKRTASIRCTTDVNILKLTRDILEKSLESYPEVSNKIRAEAKQRYLYNQEREKVKITKKRQAQTDHDVVREKLKSVSQHFLSRRFPF